MISISCRDDWQPVTHWRESPRRFPSERLKIYRTTVRGAPMCAPSFPQTRFMFINQRREM
ncbi:hypothetical protein [Xanthocytophaga flava]|uniref:hypothetical protein n=1 Tax=Xanthocytophaga flava TaxID=3048013 RepID=UPI0028D12E43|nr:hypothetical protein [Xanthocytophaga flavus]MDJ1473708.1 hypothetical protein [Xanthocytophaga flavus]